MGFRALGLFRVEGLGFYKGCYMGNGMGFFYFLVLFYYRGLKNYQYHFAGSLL